MGRVPFRVGVPLWDPLRGPLRVPSFQLLTFLAMFCGQPLDVQVSQSVNDGHPDVTWRRGAVMNAKEEDL